MKRLLIILFTLILLLACVPTPEQDAAGEPWQLPLASRHPCDRQNADFPGAGTPRKEAV